MEQVLTVSLNEASALGNNGLNAFRKRSAGSAVSEEAAAPTSSWTSCCCLAARHEERYEVARHDEDWLPFSTSDMQFLREPSSSDFKAAVVDGNTELHLWRSCKLSSPATAVMGGGAASSVRERPKITGTASFASALLSLLHAWRTSGAVAAPSELWPSGLGERPPMYNRARLQTSNVTTTMPSTQAWLSQTCPALLAIAVSASATQANVATAWGKCST
mmetsp:Transcript_37381/g.79445  ORF Transcript_37381/g.79445 Transcript_37381/m.79445 type:complete len:219 (+) Transcript_37381:211-867(+)